MTTIIPPELIDALQDVDVDNTSTVTGATVKDALDTLDVAGGGGGMVLLATGTASASTSLDFVSVLDDNLYNSYKIVVNNLLDSAGWLLLMRYSTDNGSTWISAANAYESSTNITAVAGTTDTTWNMAADITKTSIKLSGAGMVQGLSGSLELYGLGGGSTTYLTNFAVANLYGAHSSTGAELTYGVGDLSTSFNANINAVQFLSSGGTITSGTITIYGIKK